MRAADERWWADVEARALRGEWRGAEDPPPDVLERWWALAWEPDEPPPPASAQTPADPGGELSGRTAGAAGWADADRAVEQAGTALLELERATGRAALAVDAAARVDAADEGDRQDSSGGRISRCHGALDALREATAEQREALAALLDRGAGGGLVDRPRIAVVDELTGALLCLTDADELRRHATCGARSCRRDPGRCDHDLTGRPGLGPPGPSAGYRPGPRARPARPRPATGAAGSPAAVGRCRAAANSTTTVRGPTAPPRRPTWSATAPATTGESTRLPAGSTAWPPTAL